MVNKSTEPKRAGLTNVRNIRVMQHAAQSDAQAYPQAVPT
jgi:hypothetical protein